MLLEDKAAAAELVNRPEDWDGLPDRDKALIVDWIRGHLVHHRRELHSSYGLKHIMHGDIRLYVTNGQMKGAMRACGFTPLSEEDLNWVYRVKVVAP